MDPSHEYCRPTSLASDWRPKMDTYEREDLSSYNQG
jgi:hypothetical protein